MPCSVFFWRGGWGEGGVWVFKTIWTTHVAYAGRVVLPCNHHGYRVWACFFWRLNVYGPGISWRFVRSPRDFLGWGFLPPFDHPHVFNPGVTRRRWYVPNLWRCLIRCPSLATSPRAFDELFKKKHTHTCIVWSILLPIVNFNITFDPTCFFSLGCTMDRGKRHSVRDILMIYVLPPFISFSYAVFLQLHFQIIGNIYLADFLKKNLFCAR